PAPRQIRTRRFPPSGSSVDVTRGDSRPTTFRSLGDMSSNVKALGMVPFRSSHQHGPPVLGRVRALPPFPAVIAPMQPSDSLPPSAAVVFPLACGSPRCGRWFWPWGADDTCPRHVSCVGDGSPALRHTGVYRGEARASQVTGPSSSYVPWSNTPPDTSPSS